MTNAAQRIRDRVEEICTIYPAERARIERTAQSVLGLDNALVSKAFEQALRKVSRAATPSEAKEKIDALERVLVTSPGFAWLRRVEGSWRRTTRKMAIVLSIIAAGAFAVGVIAELIE